MANFKKSLDIQQYLTLRAYQAFYYRAKNPTVHNIYLRSAHKLLTEMTEAQQIQAIEWEVELNIWNFGVKCYTEGRDLDYIPATVYEMIQSA